MDLTHVRTIAALTCGGGLITLALTGCHYNATSASSSGSSPSASPSTASPKPAAAKPDHATASHGTGGGTADTGHGDTPGCMAAELRADLQTQTSNSEAKGIGTLILTNRTHHSCLIPAGWAPIGIGGPNEYRPLPATLTNYPRSGRAITLGAGRSAYAGMRWHTAAGCTTSGLGVAWHSSWIPLRFLSLNGRRAPICDFLVLGTLQPTMSGVNFT